MSDRPPVSVIVRVEGIEGLLARIPNAAKRALVAKAIIDQIGLKAVASAQEHVKVRTATLQRSILYRYDAGSLSGTVSSDLLYAPFVEKGTGIYGPFHTPVVSPSGGMMRWPVGAGGAGGFAADSGPGGTVRLTGTHTKAFAGTLKGGQGFMFRRSIKGMHPQPFMEPAWEEVQGEIEAIIDSVSDQVFASGGG